MLNWKTLKKLGDAVLFSSILGSYKTQNQIKIRLDSTRELFKRYVGRVYEDTLPSVSEVEAKEGDMCILIVNDEYIPYEVVSGEWKKYSNYYTKNEVNDKLTNLDSKYVRVNDTTIIKLNNLNEINLQEDHYNVWFGYRGGEVTNWKFGNGSNGGYADVYANDYYLNDEKLSDKLNAKQDALTDTQLSACNSGITSDKVSQYDGYASSKVNKSGDTMTGSLIAPSFIANNIDCSVDSMGVDWIRYSNGIQICWGSVSVPIGTSLLYDSPSAMYYMRNYTFNYAKGFSSNPVVSLCVFTSLHHPFLQVSIESTTNDTDKKLTTGSMMLFCASHLTIQDETSIHVQAIGRWK